MPRSNRPGSTRGPSSAYTDDGPPLSTSASGLRARMRSTGTSWATSSEYTRHSRTRLAISWEYWPPRSTTRTGRSSAPCSGTGSGTTSPTALPGHPDLLRLLELLALGLDGRGEHQLRLLEVVDRFVAARGHRGAEGAHQVQRPVVLVGGADDDLLERRGLFHLHPRPARKRWMEGGHPPVVAASRRLLGAGEGRADHHRVGAAGDGLGDVAAGAHPAVGDDVAVLPCLEQVLHARSRRVGDGGRLRDAHTEHATRRAGRTRADADEHALRTGPHEVEGRLVRGTAADDRRNRKLGDELLQVQHGPIRGDVLGGDDGALDDEDVQPGLQRHLVVLPDALRGERPYRQDA